MLADTFTSGGSGGSGSSTFPWSPPIVSPPVAANWTLVNGGTLVDVTGGVALTSVTANAITFGWVANPGVLGTAFTIYGHMNAACPGGSSTNAAYGLVVGDSAAKIVVFEIKQTGALEADNWTNATTFSGTVATTNGLVPGADIWFRLKYDTTNLIFSVSGTGSTSGSSASWIQLISATANAFLATAPAKLGFFGYAGTGGAACVNVLDHWSVTQP